MKALKNLSFLKYRYRAEEAVAALPGLIINAEKAAASILAGSHAQRKPGAGEKFWQFRDYSIGDRPQDIDWRQSAKGDRLFVREKEWQTTQTVLLWCQNNKSMNYCSAKTLPGKHDTAMILTLAISIMLSHAGEQISALESATLPGRSEKALQKLGEQLLENHTAGLPDITKRKIPNNSSIILVGDFLCPIEEIKAVFDTIAITAGNAIIIQTLDPAELTLPFEGRIIFQQQGHTQKYHVDNAASIRSAYQKRLRNHMNALKDYCKKHNWHWLLHTTDENIEKTLFDVWMMMTPESFHSRGGK